MVIFLYWKRIYTFLLKVTSMDSELNAVLIISEPVYLHYAPLGLILPCQFLFYQRSAPLGLYFWPKFVFPAFCHVGSCLA